MSGFGPCYNPRKPVCACLECADEIPYRTGVSLEMRYPMIGKVCKHRLPLFASYLPTCTKRLLDANRKRVWMPVKTRTTSHKRGEKLQ